MKVTLAMVAERVGLSKSLISMYLNNHKLAARISDDAKRRIDRVVRETGYQPSYAARALTSGQTRTIGLVIGGLTDPHLAHIADAALQATADAGYQLLLGVTRWGRDDEARALENLIARGTDGVLYCAMLGSDTPFTRRLREKKFPLLLFDERCDGHFSIAIDYGPALRKAARFLAARGRRSAAVCHHPGLDAFHQRMEGGDWSGTGLEWLPQPPMEKFDELAAWLLRRRPDALILRNTKLFQPIMARLSAADPGYRPEVAMCYSRVFPILRHPLVVGGVFVPRIEMTRTAIHTLIDWLRDGVPDRPTRDSLAADFHSIDEIPQPAPEAEPEFL